MAFPIPERTEQIRNAAAAIGGHAWATAFYPEPNDPSPAESRYLESIELFRNGKQCAGWDCFEEADRLLGI